jgi:molybdopterin molybdotransferase
MSFLRSLGIEKVEVFIRPKITVIVTGDELVEPGKELQPGQIYESNSISLLASLQEMRVSDVSLVKALDNVDDLHQKVGEALNGGDIVLLTGGVSKGKYDLVREVLEANEVKTVFHGLAQKPGGPLYFGAKDEQLVFGLPGNPAAVMACFYEYVYPAIRNRCGYKETELEMIQSKLGKDVKVNQKKGIYLKGKLNNLIVEPLIGQQSSMMSAFALADCIIYLPAGKAEWKEGEEVEIHILPKL